MAKRIAVEIDNEGEVKIEVFGATGAECEALTSEIEAALGKVTDRKRKREYYQQRQTQERRATN
jgi:Protein of unknown function (DUF2997)